MIGMPGTAAPVVDAPCGKSGSTELFLPLGQIRLQPEGHCRV